MSENRKHDYHQVYKFIIDFKESHDGNSPTIREICEACDISFTSVVKRILSILEKEGKIYLEGESRPRMIKVVGAQWRPPGSYRTSLPGYY